MKAKIEQALIFLGFLPALVAIWVYVPAVVVTLLLETIGLIDRSSAWSIIIHSGSLGYGAGYPQPGE